MKPVLGIIADDFTGATDVANTLVKRGLRVVQLIGVPDADVETGDVEAIVIALKSRTCPVGQAVDLALRAADWFSSRGIEQLLFKYCSTFDSTADGNIGPVSDALLDHVGGGLAFVCPASPENGRTIYQGHMFVGDRLLSESSMRDPPLTPMRDSALVRLMDAQSTGTCGLIELSTVRQGPDAINARCEELTAQGHRYCVIDATEESDLIAIGRAAGNHRLVTGAAGIAIGLAAHFKDHAPTDRASVRAPGAKGRSLVLAGSCSAATRAQIRAIPKHWPARKVEFDRLIDGTKHVRNLVEWALQQPGDLPVLLYGSSDPDEVLRNQQHYGTETAGNLMEAALATLAAELVAHGFGNIIVAGGETSGAVVNRLGIGGLRIGPEIEPGVPWTQSIGEAPLALALKSGNFGSADFFENAFGQLR